MWQETKHGLYREFKFDDFKQAWAFMVEVAALAEEHKHHPRWENNYNIVQIWLSTREAGGSVTELDGRLSQAIDSAYDKITMDDIVDKSTTKINELKLYADGGSRGNPGNSASGFVLLDMEDNILIERGVYLGVTTNNQAEYQALKLGLEEAKKLQPKSVHVYMDSLLVINQMLGKFKVSNRDLWPIHDANRNLANSFRHVSYTHVPRELNRLADAMVNKALDHHLGI